MSGDFTTLTSYPLLYGVLVNAFEGADLEIGDPSELKTHIDSNVLNLVEASLAKLPEAVRELYFGLNEPVDGVHTGWYGDVFLDNSPYTSEILMIAGWIEALIILFDGPY